MRLNISKNRMIRNFFGTATNNWLRFLMKITIPRKFPIFPFLNWFSLGVYNNCLEYKRHIYFVYIQMNKKKIDQENEIRPWRTQNKNIQINKYIILKFACSLTSNYTFKTSFSRNTNVHEHTSKVDIIRNIYENVIYLTLHVPYKNFVST